MKLLLLFLMAATFALSASQTTFAAFLKADKNPHVRVMSEDEECPPDPPDPPDIPE